METIEREDATLYEFGRDMDPVLTVEQGEQFAVETWDAFAGQLFEHGFGEFTAEDIPTLQAPPPAFDGNPVAGPVYVEGAEPGDTLAVTIHDIQPERGVTTTLEAFGCVANRSGWEECQVNYANEVELLPGPSGTTADGTARMELGDHEWTWDLNPHIGTIATAPGRTVQETVTTQGPWGGNMDVRDVCKGNTVFLSSFNTGGLLFVGDVHASQSDSEYTGIAVESTSPESESSAATEPTEDLTRVSGITSTVETTLHDAGYRTVDNLRSATMDELAEIDGIGRPIAARIKADVGGVRSQSTDAEPTEAESEASDGALDSKADNPDRQQREEQPTEKPDSDDESTDGKTGGRPEPENETEPEGVDDATDSASDEGSRSLLGRATAKLKSWI